NGLVAAAYLAKAGLKVLVLERRRIVGGASVTEEVFPGVRFSRLAYSAGLLRPEVIRDLDLPRFGYEVHPFDPQFFLPFPNGDSILLWNDADRNHRELARFSKRDADAGHGAHARPHAAPRDQRGEADVRVRPRWDGRHLAGPREGGISLRRDDPHVGGGPSHRHAEWSGGRRGTRRWPFDRGAKRPRERGREVYLR